MSEMCSMPSPSAWIQVSASASSQRRRVEQKRGEEWTGEQREGEEERTGENETIDSTLECFYLCLCQCVCSYGRFVFICVCVHSCVPIKCCC